MAKSMFCNRLPSLLTKGFSLAPVFIRKYSSEKDQIFEKLIDNIIKRYGSDKCSIYKSVVDLNDGHFSFSKEQAELLLSKTGDLEKHIVTLDPYYLAVKMIANGQRRGSLIFNKEENKIEVSHPIFQDIADYYQKDQLNFYEHEAIFFEIGRRSNALLSSFIWRTNRGQACGGIRLWKYNTFDNFFREGLRLGVQMGRMSSLGGLWVGGGKGLIAAPPLTSYLDSSYRKHIFLDYGEFLSSLRGCFIAAEDVGLTENDLENIFSKTRFTTCIPPELGGSGNSSIITAKGVVCAMQAALDFHELGGLQGKKVVVQGGGKVGSSVVSQLLEYDVGKVIVTDILPKAITEMKEKFKGLPVEVRLVPKGDLTILEEPCDIFSPNALGPIFTPQTIPTLNTKVICGSAADQLLDVNDNDLLVQKGICYVPDFVANRMGIVNCANEAYGNLPNDPAIERHFSTSWNFSIYNTTKSILEFVKTKPEYTPAKAANVIADHLSKEFHPIWPNRTSAIIQSLKEDWAKKGHEKH